jgi:hypothetical protein
MLPAPCVLIELVFLNNSRTPSPSIQGPCKGNWSGACTRAVVLVVPCGKISDQYTRRKNCLKQLCLND